MSIHDELERVAARAPEVVVPADTWGRAQRARRRKRYGVATVVLAVFVLAGTLTRLPSRDGPDPVDSDAIGVPSRLWAVPERLTRRAESGWASDEVTPDVTVVGVGAASWVDWGLPIVVDATSGGYHLLDLPDFIGEHTVVDTPAVALSPDGRRLAYGYAVVGPAAETEPVPSGIRVVDLQTGATREIPVEGEEGIVIARIAWSPDGRWLAFTGTQQSWWTEQGGFGTSEYLDTAGPVLGRVTPDSETVETVGIDDDLVTIAVDDLGRVSFAPNGVRTWDGDRVTRDRDTDRRRFDLGLGFTGDGDPVRLVTDNRYGAHRFGAVAVETGQGSVKITLGPDISQTLSLATGLMTRERPTVDRPAPEWPTDWASVVTRIAWIAVPSAFLLMLVLPWLRRRLSARRPTTGPAPH